MTTTRDPTNPVTSTIPLPRAEPTRGAVDQRVVDRLTDTLIHDLFDIGLRLQTVLPSLSQDAAHQLNAVIDDTDRIIRDIRNVVFASAVPRETVSQSDSPPSSAMT